LAIFDQLLRPDASIAVSPMLLLLLGGCVALAIVFGWYWRYQLLRQTRSGDVRRGYISEALAPFLDGFPVDVQREGTTTVFLGQPVDFVHFDPESGVVFVEVKSGRSALNDRQRRLRDLVASGAVRWETYRVR
jgi:hypothetical protein